ncbi:hypothetical protein EX895_000787 [Sporisorium graminicola]|uniref:Uncharacterized protein n=1 Tax=Sporisorium graminicola TaxID=280036 RepID=A0A4V6EUR4_9BASI|nr:hypothetical protein EX895_000787 [Sporisorium graminicola]TKY90789.1 hypothetical protein EX895_000787 [Sporisorium graminicola]
MVSLPRFFHTNRTDDDASSPPIELLASATVASEMARPSSSSLPVLGTPGSLKTVFGSSDTRDSSTADDYIDEILPEYLQGSLLASNATVGRRSRLDESAGEGLRRNVLVRNAMLSSLERERRQLSEDLSAPAPEATVHQSDRVPGFDEEAQFFEDLLSELSGSDSFGSVSTVLEASIQESGAHAPFWPRPESADEEEDFVELDSSLPSEALLAHLVSSPYTDTIESATAVAPMDRDEAVHSVAQTLVGSCSSALSAPRECIDSGFAEAVSRPASVASCCIGYPNVCPYPATHSFTGCSSEELPALIDDDDSDLDDDEDEVDAQSKPAAEMAQAMEGSPHEVSLLPSPDGDAALSRPLSPVTSPIPSVYHDYTSFRDPLSPEASRPTSPISSASSKGDGDGPSPLLLPSDLGPLPSLAELSLQLPAVSGTNPLTRPSSRALVGPWFEHKQDVSGSTNGDTDRMHWTISSALHSRPTPVASSSTTISDHNPHRLLFDSHRGGYPFAATNDPSDHSIVVHWSR